MKTTKNYNPGSLDSYKLGCTCPHELNNWGRPDGRWIIGENCPVHSQVQPCIECQPSLNGEPCEHVKGAINLEKRTEHNIKYLCHKNSKASQSQPFGV